MTLLFKFVDSVAGEPNVYRARGELTGSSGAVKVVDLRRQSVWAEEKLKTEQKALVASQSHPHIIRFHGGLRRGPYHVLVFEDWGQDLLEQVLQDKGYLLKEISK